MHGIIIKNKSGSVLYDTKNVRCMFFIGRRRAFGNEWFLPFNLKNYTSQFSCFSSVVRWGGTTGVFRPFTAKNISGYADGLYLGYSVSGGTPASSSRPSIDRNVLCDYFFFGSISRIPVPKNGIVIAENVNDPDSITFHSGGVPLQMVDLLTISKGQTRTYPSNVAIEIFAPLWGYSGRKYHTVSACNNTVRTTYINYPAYLETSYATSYTLPVIDADYYSRYGNAINP